MVVTAKDPGKKHFYNSVAKSILRMGGCVILFANNDPLVVGFAVLFFVAEIFGILEEL